MLPVSISLCTGVPSGMVILCRKTSLNTGSGIHKVVAVRKVFRVGVAEMVKSINKIIKHCILPNITVPNVGFYK